MSIMVFMLILMLMLLLMLMLKAGWVFVGYGWVSLGFLGLAWVIFLPIWFPWVFK
mgnify:CR=1 FL=1